MGMVTKEMGKRYIQTVYSSSNMKSEPQNHANNYLCLLTHINFKNLHKNVITRHSFLIHDYDCRVILKQASNS